MTHLTYARRLRLGPLLAGGFLAVAAITLVLVTRLIAPATQAVSWTLVYVNGPPQTSTVVVVDEHWNDCGAGRVVGLPSGAPAIGYTSSSVTITMPRRECVPCPDGVTTCHDSGSPGIPTGVALTEPLRGRALFDGSVSPPAPRPYP